MRQNEVKMTMYRKDEKGRYVYYYEITDENEVYKDLCNILIAKKLQRCTYVTKITDENLYNGFRKIKVYTPFKYFYEYIVRDH